VTFVRVEGERVSSTTAHTDRLSPRSVAVVGLILVLAATGCDWLLRRPARVEVRNSTGADIHNLRLTAVGDDDVIGDLRRSETRIVKLKPKGDSGLVLSFTDGAGRSCRQEPDVYLDRMLGGDIAVDLLSCEVSSTSMPGGPTRLNK
jgi:hypothetical protein